MPKFQYLALGPDGGPAKGIQDAPTLAAARLALVQAGLRITKIEPKKSWTEFELTPTRIKPQDLMHLSRQLSAFLRAGIPILDAIQVLAEESDKASVRRVMSSLGADLRSGSTFSDAVEKHPGDFPEWYRGILRSAELTGRLDSVLDHLSGYIERDVEARRKITGALIYPAIIFVMACAAIAVLSVWVLPKFETFFATFQYAGHKVELPLPTRMLMASTRFLSAWWWLLIGGALAAALGAFLSGKTRGGRFVLHRLVLGLPVIGEAVRYTCIERFTRLLASMVEAGVPLPRAMEVATSSLNNTVFQRALGAARQAMVQGNGLAAPIADTRLFPGVASQMIRVGEETGTLDTQLEVAAKHYERELEYKIKKVTTLIEPVVITIMGGIVGFVAIALVSAMYGIFTSVKI